MSGTDVLTDIEVSSIQIQYGLGVGQNSNEGIDGQVLSSQGRDKPMRWVNQAGGGALQQLTQSTGITISPDGVYDGSTAQSISATFPAFTGGNGITIDGTGAITTNNDGTTMTNTGGDGGQNAVLKVPNSLTAGSNITLTGGTEFNGENAIVIASTDTNTEYTATAPINISLLNVISVLTDGITIDGVDGLLKVREVPFDLTCGNGLTFTSGTTFDGADPRQIQADTDEITIKKTGGTGDELEVIKVPNDLTFIYQASPIPYNGSQQVSIDLDTLVEEAQPTASDGISISAGEISTDNDGTTIGHNSITKKNEVLRTPANLIAGTNITFTGGAEFDGSTEITISATDTTSTDSICFTRASTSNKYSFPNFINSTDWSVASYGFLPVGDTFFTLKIPASIVGVMLNDTTGRFEMEWSVYIEELICGEGANGDFRDVYYKYQFAKDDIFTTDLQIIGRDTYDFCSGGGANDSIGSVGSGIPTNEPNSQGGRVRVMKDVLFLSDYISHTETPVDVYIRVLMSNEPLTNNEKAHILLECGLYQTTASGVDLYRPDCTMESTPLKNSNYIQYVEASPSPSAHP